MDTLFQLESPVLFFIKFSLVSFLAIYLVFSLVVFKQVRVMNRTLDVGFEPTLLGIAFLHLSLAVFVLFLSIFLL